MLPIQFVYLENGKEKSPLDEHARRVEILEHNKRLNEQYPVYLKDTPLYKFLKKITHKALSNV